MKTTSSASLRRALALGCTAGLALAACGPTAALPQDSYSAQEQFLKVCAARSGDGGFVVTSGIDISNNNGAGFNLRAEKANGISFVYMKASEGITIQDPDYAGFLAQAETLGLAHGAYHFFIPGDDGTRQAQNFLGVIDRGLDAGALSCSLPPVLDWEVVDGVPWSEAEANAQAWLNAVQKATGQTPMIYTSSSFFLPVPGGLPASFAGYPLWVAEYGPTCPNVNAPWSGWTLFQFGTANNSLDHDYFNGTLAELQGMASCTSGDGGVLDGGLCNSNGDCPSNEVCEQPALICGGETGAPQCTPDVATLQGQQCQSNADCNPASGAGTLICAACPSTCGGGTCCQAG
ncbi:MAG: glycoside hydrolase family 25 protein [Myxococcales bacterium]